MTAQLEHKEHSKFAFWVIRSLEGDLPEDVVAGKVDAKTQRCPDNGATIDVKTCVYPEDKGDAELSASWSDPEFDPKLNAFYYARVLENPTCRWSTWDANRLGIEPNPDLPKTIQERAYTSPIWFIPTKAS